MATITADTVASVSLNDADREPDSFAEKLGRSFEEYGFAIIADHGIPDELIHDAEEKAKAFFALPEEVKRKYHIAGGGGARGYTPFGIETAKGAQAFDLKEFWHVGRELAAGHPFRDHMGDNVWPEELPGFKDTFLKLFETFDRTGLKILKAIARFLKIDEDYFIDTVRDGNSVLRLLHYPPIQGEPGSNVRAGAHEDINTITLLLGAEEAGLELLTRDGRWVAVSASSLSVAQRVLTLVGHPEVTEQPWFRSAGERTVATVSIHVRAPSMIVPMAAASSGEKAGRPGTSR